MTKLSPEEMSEKLSNVYITHPRDDKLRDEVTKLIKSAGRPRKGKLVGRAAEGRMLALIGRSGAGKTRALERIFSTVKRFENLNHVDAGCSAISVNARAPWTLKALLMQLLETLGFPMAKDDEKEFVLMRMVRQRLQLCGVNLIHIDEFSNVTKDGYAPDMKKVRDTLKGLMQPGPWPVWLIVSGTPAVAKFIEDDDQLRRRCKFVPFTDLSSEDEVVGFAKRLKSLVEAKAGLKLEVDAITFARRALHGAKRQYGTGIDIIQDAIIDAVTDGDVSLKGEHFARAYASRTGCLDSENVFLAVDWQEIDVSTSMQTLFGYGVGEERGRKER